MNKTPRISESTALRSMLLIMGAWAFTWCLSVTVHEIGHAIAYSIVKLPDIKIIVHPFDLSHTTTSLDKVPFGRPFIDYMGPLFNLLCATVITLILWRKRSPFLVPLLMWPANAFLQEGVAVFIGIAEYFGGSYDDWGMVMRAGIPPIVVAIIGILFIVIGIAFLNMLMPLMNISPTDPFWKRLMINLGGIMPYFILSVLYVSLFGPAWLVETRLIALVSAIFLVLLFTVTYKLLYPFLDRLSHTDIIEVKWSAARLALGLGATIVIIEILFLNG